MPRILILLKLLQKFDAVPERVKDVDAVIPCEGFVRERRKPSGLAPGGEFWQATYQDGRVRFTGRAEGWVYAKM
jgi:hypothetical protein